MIKMFYFFFSSRRRHTRLQGDWSSDVCSSDLLKTMRAAFNRARERIENLDFLGAARELSSMIEPRKDKKARDLSVEEQRLLCAAYDMRGRAQFNLGNTRGAEADFT